MEILNKLKEWFRLKKEISDLRLKIWSKETKAKNSLLNYKHLGLPVLKMNLSYKEKMLKELGMVKSVDVGVLKTRKIRSDKGGTHRSRLTLVK